MGLGCRLWRKCRHTLALRLPPRMFERYGPGPLKHWFRNPSSVNTQIISGRERVYQILIASPPEDATDISSLSMGSNQNAITESSSDLSQDENESASMSVIDRSSALTLASSALKATTSTKTNTEIETKRASKADTTKTKTEHKTRTKQLQKKAPRYIVCMGLSGSGKSTFANRLAESFPPSNGWLIINQDRLGKRECEKLARKSRRGVRVVL